MYHRIVSALPSLSSIFPSPLWAIPSTLAIGIFLKYLTSSFKCWWFMPPGPRGVPFVGNLFQMQSPKPWLLLTRWGEQFGPIYSLSILGMPIIILNTIEAAADLLDRRPDKYSARPRMVMGGELMTHNEFLVFTKPGAQFNRLRRAAHDGLNPRAVKKYCLVQEREAALLTLNLARDPSSLHKEIQRTMTSLIISVLYGWEPLTSVDHPVINEVLETLYALEASALPGRHLIDIFPSLLILPRALSKWKREGEYYYNKNTSLFGRMIDEVRQKRDQLPDCVAATLLDKVDEGELSHSEAAWLAGTLFVGGTESVGQTLSTLILIISLYQDVLRRVQAEIDAVVGKDRMPTAQDAEKLPYLSAVIKEVIRWNTVSLSGVPRQCSEDDWYKGYYIPKGTFIIPNIWGMQRDGSSYPDPDVFSPERFLDESGRLDSALPDTHGQGHVTFGFGKRLCPGMHLANQSLFISVVSLLWAFDIRNPTYMDGKPIKRVEEALTSHAIVIHPVPYHCEFRHRFPEVRGVVESELAKRL